MITEQYAQKIADMIDAYGKAEERLAKMIHDDCYGLGLRRRKLWAYLKGVYALDIPVLKRLGAYYHFCIDMPDYLPRAANGVSLQVIGEIALQFGKDNFTLEVATALCNEAIDARYTLQSIKELLRDNKPDRPLVTSEQACKALGEAKDYLGGNMDSLDTVSVEMQLAASKPLGLVKRYLAQAAKREGENDEKAG